MEEITLTPTMHIHLIGIGGTGMSAIAHVLHGQGYTVSGSDRQTSVHTEALQAIGVRVENGHDAAHIKGADLLVVSSAVPQDNPEWVAAVAAGIPVWKRDRFLGLLMGDKHGIAIAGSHGKTTTTAMISQMLLAANLEPTFILGGLLPGINRNGRAGSGQHFVVEADEYDRMFLGLRPQTAIITNIGYDHPDIYPDEGDYKETFHQFVSLLPQDGLLIVCLEDSGVQQLLERPLPHLQIETYGLSKTAIWRAVDLRVNYQGGTDFVVQYHGKTLGVIRLRVPGDHNVLNGLAAIAVGHSCGIPFGQMIEYMAAFGGVGRRFELSGEWAGVTIIDDYAHHPTEIKATLAAAAQQFPGRRLWAVWQPHTYSRTKSLLAEFANSFESADRVVVLDIYRSRELDNLGLDGAKVAQAIVHEEVVYGGTHEAASAYLLDRVKPGDVILTLGAGDGNVVGKTVLEGLQERFEIRSTKSWR